MCIQKCVPSVNVELRWPPLGVLLVSLFFLMRHACMCHFCFCRCVLCHREGNTKVCHKCVACLKTSLVDANLDAALLSSPGAGRISFCVSCAQVVRGAHEEHEGRIIPLRPSHKLWAAWDNGYESWSALFDGVQTDQVTTSTFASSPYTTN